MASKTTTRSKTLRAAAAASRKPTVTKSKTTRSATTKTVRSGSGIDLETRNQMIAEAAYYIAKNRGFTEGDPSNDWIEAERQIDALIAAQAN